MGASFSLFKFNKYPKCPKTNGSNVFTRGDKELYGQPAKTKVTLESESAYERYERYQAYHEALKRTRGRLYEGQEFDAFYLRNEFPIFVERDARMNRQAVCEEVSNDESGEF
jgi:hypothetical protein